MRIQDSTQLRPTLIFGIGGTGYDIVLRAKARFSETYSPEALRKVRFMVLDTDPNYNAPVSDSTGKSVYFAPEEHLFIGNVNPREIINNPSSHPEIHAEIPDLERLSAHRVIQGANQVRLLGRLAFLFHYRKIRDLITHTLLSLRNISNVAQYGDVAKSAEVINLFFATSACGGTGSGMIFDLAYLARHLAKTVLNSDDRQIFSTGMFVLPEAFPGINQSSYNQIRANAYAHLRELDHFIDYCDFNVLYPQGERIGIAYPPFDVTYLVDAVNDNNETVQGMQQLAPIMAEALFLHAGSYLGSDVVSIFANIRDSVIRSRDNNGSVRAYSRLGASTLRFNAERMRRACANRLSTKLLGDVLLNDNAQYTPEECQSNVNAYLAEAQLSRNDIQTVLQMMPEREIMRIDCNTDVFDSVSPQDMVSQVERYCVRYEKDVLNTKYREQIARNQKKAAEEALRVLDQRIFALCDDAEQGVVVASQFLRELERQIQALLNDLGKERKAAESAMTRVQRDIDGEQRPGRNKKMGSRGRFIEAAQAPRILGLFQKPLTQARRHYTRLKNEHMSHQLTQMWIGQATSLLNEVAVRCGQLLGLVATLNSTLQTILVDTQRRFDVEKDTWYPSYVTECNIVGDEEILSFYDRHLNQEISNVAAEWLNRNSLSEWLSKLESSRAKSLSIHEEITHCLSEFTYEKFDNIFTDTVEQLIQPASNKDAELSRLVHLAAPFAKYNSSMAELDHILIVGVCDKDNSIYTQAPARVSKIISTGDPYRISVLNTEHGFPLYALGRYEEYQRHFATFRAKEGLYGALCFRSVEAELAAYLPFVQAQALNFIVYEGARGYVAKIGDRSYDLGRDLKSAVGMVVQDRNLLEELETGVKEWMREHSHADVVAALDDYIDHLTSRMNMPSQPNRVLSPLEQELVAIAQGERESHQRRLLR